MARPRKPLALAKIEGRDKVNAGRFKGRNEPSVNTPVGDPPPYIMDTEENKARSAWYEYAVELSWLNSSHRSLLEMASLIRGEIMAGRLPGIQRLNLLRQCLGSMGATPADASKVGAGGNDDNKDPEDAFFE